MVVMDVVSTVVPQARALSTLRGFFRYLDRMDLVHNPAASSLRTPRLPKSVPKALSEGESLEAVKTVEEVSDTPWIGKRDGAVLALLYGCGLRIGEALSLDRRQAPLGERLTVTGKGRKQRMVPVLPVVAGNGVTAEARSRCDAEGVWLVLDGRVVPPNGTANSG